MQPVTLRTSRLVLRPFASADAEAVLAACQDPDIQHFTPVPVPYRIEHARAFVDETVPKGWETGSDHILGAFRRDNDALVGSFCLTRMFEGVYELGYWAAKEQRGHGYAFEAAPPPRQGRGPPVRLVGRRAPRTVMDRQLTTPGPHEVAWPGDAAGAGAGAEKLPRQLF